MRRLAFLLGGLVIGGLLVSSAYAGSKVAVDSRNAAVIQSVSQPKVEVARASFAEAVRTFLAVKTGLWFIKGKVKESIRPSEPQKGWGYRPGVGREYIYIRDHGGDTKDI